MEAMPDQALPEERRLKSATVCALTNRFKLRAGALAAPPLGYEVAYKQKAGAASRLVSFKPKLDRRVIVTTCPVAGEVMPAVLGRRQRTLDPAFRLELAGAPWLERQELGRPLAAHH